MKLSLCMIVRDNEHTIGPCLQSIQPFVDEMVIVDTGSVDGTPDIVRSFGASLFHETWDDNFSKARNVSIEHARGKWVFWMDSDDTIPEECAAKLRELANSEHSANTLGYVMQVRCPGGNRNGINEYTVVDHVKMFRNLPEIRFEGRIHEQVLMPIRRLGGEIDWTDIFVEHSGSENTPESRRRKVERDLRILRKDLEERPNHPFVLFNFAMTYAEEGQFEEALPWIEESLQYSQPQESHVRKLYAYLANCHQHLRRPSKSLQACRQGRELYPDDPELLFREGMALHDLKRFDESIARYQELLRLPPHCDGYQSADPGIRDFKCRFNLGVVYRDAGHLGQAEQQWRRVLEEQPMYRPARRALGQVLLQQERLSTAEIEAFQLLETEASRADGLLLLARLQQHRGNIQAAEEHLSKCLEVSPDDVDVVDENIRFRCDHGELGRAQELLEHLLILDPDNATALHNLGSIQLQQNDPVAAVASLERSLLLRPNADHTRGLLELATSSSGQSAQAQVEPAPASQDGPFVDPGDSDPMKPSREGNSNTVACENSSHYRFNFDGGTSDWALIARLLRLYMERELSVGIKCPAEFEAICLAAGAEVIEQGNVTHPWEAAEEDAHATHGRDWQGNKPFWNLRRAPVALEGSIDELWDALVRTEPDATKFISETDRNAVEKHLAAMERPIVLVRLTSDAGSQVDGVSPEFASALYRGLLDRSVGTVFVLDDRKTSDLIKTWRVRFLSDIDCELTASKLLVLIDAAALVVSVDAGPLHLCNLTQTPSVGIWGSGDFPSQSSLPCARQLNLVLPEPKGSNQFRRICWHLVESQSDEFDSKTVADVGAAMIAEPRYLSTAHIASDVQLQQWIQKWCRDDSGEFRDRNRSFDFLFREIAKRFKRPTIVETGTIRKEEDWAGAGFFTYLAGAFVRCHGGTVYSVDHDPKNCEFALSWCQPFGKSVAVHCEDSVTFLKRFEQAMDVLYLDSLDTYEPGCAEHALTEVQAAEKSLHEKSLVVLDDSPLQNGTITGKAALALPWLLERGWSVAFADYQVILRRD